MDNYHYIITTYDENGLVEKEECWFKDGVSKTVNRDLNNEKITYIDFNNQKGYITETENKLKIDIDFENYNKAHKNYKYGGQLIDRIPKILKNNRISTILIEALGMDFKIYEERINITTRNNYICLDKNNILPVIMYSNDNKNLINYVIEINTVDGIDI